MTKHIHNALLIKLSLVVLFFIFFSYQPSFGQCPVDCDTTTATYVINPLNNTDAFIISGGETMYIPAGETFAGTLNFNGGAIYICAGGAVSNAASFTYSGNASIVYNSGTFHQSGNFIANKVSFDNCDGGVITFDGTFNMSNNALINNFKGAEFNVNNTLNINNLHTFNNYGVININSPGYALNVVGDLNLEGTGVGDSCYLNVNGNGLIDNFFFINNNGGVYCNNSFVSVRINNAASGATAYGVSTNAPGYTMVTRGNWFIRTGAGGTALKLNWNTEFDNVADNNIYCYGCNFTIDHGGSTSQEKTNNGNIIIEDGYSFILAAGWKADFTNNGVIDTYNFLVDDNNALQRFYNNCLVIVRNDFVNKNQILGPTTAPYGKFIVEGATYTNTGKFGCGLSESCGTGDDGLLDFCHQSNPADVLPGNVGINVTYCTNDASCAAMQFLSTIITVTPNNSCPGTNDTISATSTGGTPPYTYAWSTGNTTDSVIIVSPTVTSTYTLTATGGAQSQTSEVVVTVSPPPTIIINNPSICPGVQTTLTASGANTYVWNTVGTYDTISVAPIIETTYTVTATDASGCTNTEEAVISINAPPTAAVNDTAMCIGAAANLRTSAYSSYSWTGGGTTQGISVTPTTTTTYIVTVTDGNGCTDTEDGIVTVDTLPIAAVNDTTICLGAAARLRTDSYSSYNWNTTEFSQGIDVAPTTNTTYSVTVTDGNGCTDTEDGVVTVHALPTAAVSDSAICLNLQATLTASGATTYLWNTPSTNTSIDVSPTTTTTYTVTATDANGCTDTENGVVIVNTLPTAVVNDSTICRDLQATLTASGATTYLWNIPSTNTSIDISPTTTTTYTVTATDANGCTDTEDGLVTVNALPTAVVNDSTICRDLQATLTASGATTYLWNTPSTNTSIDISPTTTTTYTVTATDTNDCTDTENGIVIVNTLPTAVVNDSTICRDLQATLNVSGAATYLWNTPSTNTSINVSPTVTSTYTVTATDANGCTDTEDGIVTVNALPTASVNDSTICSGFSAILTASGASNFAWSNASSNASILESPTITTTYTVTITDDNGCTDTEDGIVTVNILPLVEAGSIVDTIPHGTFTTLDATTDSVVSNNWVSSNAIFSWTHADSLVDATIEDPQTVNLTQTNMFNLTVTDTVTGCQNYDTSYVIVTGGPLSISNFTISSDSICLNDFSILSAMGSGGSGDYSYSWSSNPPGLYDSTFSITVSPTVTTKYVFTVVVDDGFNTILDSGEVVLNPLPVAIVSNDTICRDQQATLLAGGATSYIWNTVETTDSINTSPTISATYTVTATDDNGCTDTEIGVVTVNILPTATVNDTAMCDAETANLRTDAFTSYNWTSGSTNQGISVTPNATTTYLVTVTDINGCTDTEDGIVTVNALPTAGVNDTTMCDSETANLRTESYTSYIWSGGETSRGIFVAPNDTSSYTVTVTTADGCTDTQNGIVSVNPLPTASVNDTTMCDAETANLRTESYASYVWTGGGNTQGIVITPNISTTYIVTVTDINGCTDTEDGVVTVNALPTANVNDTTMCDSETANLRTEIYSAYLWSNANTNQGISVTPNASTTYTVTVTTTNGCTDTEDGIVTVNALPTASVNDTAMCNMEAARLRTNSYASYFWSTTGNQQGIDIAPNVTTTYTVTVTTAEGCTDTEEGIVTVHSLPIASVSNQTICFAQTATLTASGANNFIWSNTQTNAAISISPIDTETFSVTITDNNGCTDTEDGVVTVYPLPTVSVSNQTICFAQTATLTASGANNFIWSNAQTNAAISISPIATETFSVTITDNNGCTDTEEAIVTVNAVPTVDASSNTPVCSGEQVELYGNPTGLSYIWTGPDNFSSTEQNSTISTEAEEDMEGRYKLVVTNSTTGCLDSAFTSIIINTTPFALHTANKIEITQFQSVTFNGDVSQNAFTWEWDFGDGNTIIGSDSIVTHEYSNFGNFQLRLIVTGEGGCSDTTYGSKFTKVNELTDIFIPTAFTPNGDLENDIFYIRGLLSEMEITVFNQWGILIFQSSDQEQGWDGKTEGKESPEGNYVYQFKGVSLGGSDININGIVTLIR